MWHEIVTGVNDSNPAWRKVDDDGRIIGRINKKEGEYSASKVVVDADGVGRAVHRGFYLTLANAKAAVDEE